MSHNTFGHLLRVTTFGESHGPAIGCVVDGCPPLIPLEDSEIQHYLDKRRPGQSRFTTQRQEADQVKILSGVFFDEETKRQVTTGTPVALLIENTGQRSKTTARSRIFTGPAMRISPMMRSTASGITAAAGAHRLARPRCALLQARLRARSFLVCKSVVRSFRWGRIRSTAPAGIGTRSQTIHSSAPTQRLPPSSNPISKRCASPALR